LGERQVELALSGNDSEQTEIVLVTSMIFGNEILNATGLVKHSQFKRTNEYNAISAEVNRIVESELVPAFLEEAKVGSTVHFIGCSSKISDDDPVPIPMRLVPVKLEVQ
jgi:predicted lipoprotein